MPIRRRADWEYTERQKLLMKGGGKKAACEQTGILKPCPFCGEFVEFNEHDGLTMSNHYTTNVICNECEIETKWGWGKTREEANEAAAKIWNTRLTPKHSDPNRFEVVSEPGAVIEVTRINLTDDERESLSINKRLSDLGQVCRCGHDKDRHHDDVDTWCGYWNAGCDCRGYQISFGDALRKLRK